MTPIESMLNGVAWEAIAAPESNAEGLPYPTHSGVLNIGGALLRCHQLNDGRRIFEADDIAAFLDGTLGATSSLSPADSEAK